MQPPWKLRQSRMVYENDWIRVREDRFLLPSGNEGLYGVVEIRPSVGILAMDERGQIALVGQWRYPGAAAMLSSNWPLRPEYPPVRVVHYRARRRRRDHSAAT